MNPVEVPPIARRCVVCGAAFDVTTAEQAALLEKARQRPQETWRLPVRCPHCRQQARRVVNDGRVEWLRCDDCGDTFEFGGSEKAAFVRKGLLTPRRCRACRAARWQQAPRLSGREVRKTRDSYGE